MSWHWDTPEGPGRAERPKEPSDDISNLHDIISGGSFYDSNMTVRVLSYFWCIFVACTVSNVTNGSNVWIQRKQIILVSS